MRKLLLQAAVIGLILFGVVELFDALSPSEKTEAQKQVVETQMDEANGAVTAEKIEPKALERTKPLAVGETKKVAKNTVKTVKTGENTQEPVKISNTITNTVNNSAVNVDVKPINTGVVVVNRDDAIENPQSTAVDVYVYEYDFDFSKKTIPAGTVVFTVRNTGVTSHSFGVRGKQDFGVVKPGEIKTFVTELSAGDWEVYSSRTRDEIMNLRETITVR